MTPCVGLAGVVVVATVAGGGGGWSKVGCGVWRVGECTCGRVVAVVVVVWVVVVVVVGWWKV